MLQAGTAGQRLGREAPGRDRWPNSRARAPLLGAAGPRDLLIRMPFGSVVNGIRIRRFREAAAPSKGRRRPDPVGPKSPKSRPAVWPIRCIATGLPGPRPQPARRAISAFFPHSPAGGPAWTSRRSRRIRPPTGTRGEKTVDRRRPQGTGDRYRRADKRGRRDVRGVSAYPNAIRFCRLNAFIHYTRYDRYILSCRYIRHGPIPPQGHVLGGRRR
jgi:hypothetical protein